MQPQITKYGSIISQQEFIQENRPDIITRGVVTRKDVRKRKGKRMRSVSSDEEVEIVKITKRKGKGKREKERMNVREVRIVTLYVWDTHWI
jgi:hypothetical protein